MIDSNSIREQVSLKPYNTFGISATATYFAPIGNIDDFLQLRTTQVFRTSELLILGGGSNILFTQNPKGLVIKNNLKGIEVIEENSGFVFVRVAAGEVWHSFVLWCVARGYGGVENLSLIPGLVGASPMQNIGAYGAEIKDVCISVDAIEIESGKSFSFSNEDCQFGYRESIFKHSLKNKMLITSVVFKLTKQPTFNVKYGDIQATLEEMQVRELSLKAISDAVIKIRSSKLPNPAELGNAGSFFKNPTVENSLVEKLLLTYPVMPNYPQANGTKIPAGWLIEQCGWKGKRVGNTGSHAKQALVLVNYGEATGAEVFALALDIQRFVFEKFGIKIEPEVNVV